MHHPYCSSCKKDHPYEVDCEGRQIDPLAFSEELSHVVAHRIDERAGRSTWRGSAKSGYSVSGKGIGDNRNKWNYRFHRPKDFAYVPKVDGGIPEQVATRIAATHGWSDYKYQLVERYGMYIWKT